MTSNEHPNDLDTNAKTRILLEEQYRQEIKSRLVQKEEINNKSRLWKFLNSSFGIWLLTSVVVSGLGTLYTTYQDQRKSEEIKSAEQREQSRIRQTSIERLDLEIAFRFSQYISALSQIYDFQNDGRFGKLASGDLYSFMGTPEAVSRERWLYINPLYDDNKDKTTTGIVAEISRLEQSKEEISELRRVISNLSNLRSLFTMRGLDRYDKNAKAVASFFPRFHAGEMEKRFLSS